MRMILAAAAMAAAVGAASAASATTFTGTYTPDVYDGNDNGLHIETTDSLPAGNGFSFNLTSNGQQAIVNLFSIYTTENEIDNDDDNPRSISVLFHFTAPGVQNGTVEGDTFAISAGVNRGHVTWDTTPVNVNFGSLGTINIKLNDTDFNQGPTGGDNLGTSKAQITGTFTLSNVTSPVGGVPEPATWGLMITGFGMAGATLRRRRSAAAAA